MRKLLLMGLTLAGLHCAPAHTVKESGPVSNYNTRLVFSEAALRTLSRDFDNTDMWQKERGYCVKDFTVVKSRDTRYIMVHKISRAVMIFADQRSAAFLCGFWRFQAPSIHTHPPSNCFQSLTTGRLECVWTDFRKSECVPSDPDMRMAELYPARFHIVQCWDNIFQVYAYKER